MQRRARRPESQVAIRGDVLSFSVSGKAVATVALGDGHFVVRSESLIADLSKSRPVEWSTYRMLQSAGTEMFLLAYEKWQGDGIAVFPVATFSSAGEAHRSLESIFAVLQGRQKPVARRRFAKWLVVAATLLRVAAAGGVLAGHPAGPAALPAAAAYAPALAVSPPGGGSTSVSRPKLEGGAPMSIDQYLGAVEGGN
jgi:hypothetical protein